MSTTDRHLLPSRRGLANIKPNLMQDLSREIEAYIPYDKKSHPEGLLDITSSLNELMDTETQSFVKKRVHFSKDVLKYGSVAGSPELTTKLSRFINQKFCPSSPINPDNIMVTNGVTSLIDQLCYSICDQGEAIMYTTPVYGMFKTDIQYRNGIEIIEVPCSSSFDQFKAINTLELISMFEKALKGAKKDGICVKAILICNPCNPFGRCYSRSTLIELSKFCAVNNLHLISDEIYAMSGFTYSGTNFEDPDFEAFTSALSIIQEAAIDNQSVHVLYGASKDFGLSGLRLGFLITTNSLLKESCRRTALFTWVTTYSDTVFTKFLSDEKYLTRFFQIYQTRLRESYLYTAEFLSRNSVPFDKANAGIFIWVDLSRWTRLIKGSHASNESSEVILTRKLLKNGVYLEPGEAFYSPYQGRYRLCYAKDTEKLAVGLKRIVSILRQLEKPDSDTISVESFDELEKAKSRDRPTRQGKRNSLWCFW